MDYRDGAGFSRRVEGFRLGLQESSAIWCRRAVLVFNLMIGQRFSNYGCDEPPVVFVDAFERAHLGTGR